MRENKPAGPTVADIAKFYEGRLVGAQDSKDHGAEVRPPLAGDYSAQELSTLPKDLVASSFGCGNPLAFAGVRAGQSVLDLGCGAGLDLVLAARSVGPTGQLIGVDASEVMVDRARAAAAREGLANVEVRQGTIDALPVEDASIDWVISNCVINLASNKDAVFREVHRVLRPGGRMLVSDIVADDLPDWLTSSTELYAACISGALPEQDYLAAIARAGLTNGRIVDRLTYGEGELILLIRNELPAVLTILAQKLGRTESDLLALIVSEISGKVKSVKVSAQRPEIALASASL